jgi:hypothetical protein
MSLQQKLLLALCTACLTIGSMGTATAQSTFSGWSVQTSVGFSQAQTSIKTRTHYQSLGGDDDYGTYSANENYTSSSPQLAAQANYTFQLNSRYLLTVGLFAQLNSYKKNEVAKYQHDYTTNLAYHSAGFQSQQQFAYGIELSPGYLINNQDLLYANFAIADNHFDNKFGASYIHAHFAGDIEQAAASTESTDALSYALGFGFARHLQHNLSVFAELNYSILPSFSVKRVVSDSVTDRMRTEKFEISSTTTSIKAGIRYHF